MEIQGKVQALRLRVSQVGLFVKMFFWQWYDLPEFQRRLKKHFAEAAMGGTITGIGIFIVALFTSLPHWVWLLVLVGMFFFSAYAVFREEHRRSGQLAQQMEEQRTALRAQIENVRQREAGKQPQIVYDHFDESSVKHPNDGLIYRYAHLWFCNQPTGRPALDAAARITVCDSSDRQLFAVDGKWMEVQHDLGRAIHGKNKIDLLPNGAAHGLDLLIRASGAADCYGFHVESPYRGFRRDLYRVPSGTYTVKVVISCEGYTQDFRFKMQNEGENQAIKVEQIAPEGVSLDVRASTV
jgi:hypothetical protein